LCGLQLVTRKIQEDFAAVAIVYVKAENQNPKTERGKLQVAARKPGVIVDRKRGDCRGRLSKSVRIVGVENKKAR
jgi:hypothetical protein